MSVSGFLLIKTAMQIMLSEPSQRFVLGRVAELGLDRPEQYVEQLLEEEKQRRLDEYYMEKIREGLASGLPIPVTPGYWDELADRIERKVEERKRKVVQ
jgi:hypothetical protein